MNKRGCRCSENNRINLLRLFLTIAHNSIFRYLEVNTGLLSYLYLFSTENIFQTIETTWSVFKEHSHENLKVYPVTLLFSSVSKSTDLVLVSPVLNVFQPWSLKLCSNPSFFSELAPSYTLACSPPKAFPHYSAFFLLSCFLIFAVSCSFSINFCQALPFFFLPPPLGFVREFNCPGN